MTIIVHVCERGREKRGNRETERVELGFMYVPYIQVGFRLQYGGVGSLLP